MNGGQLRGEIEAGGYSFDASLIRAIATEAMRLQREQGDVGKGREGRTDQHKGRSAK